MASPATASRMRQAEGGVVGHHEVQRAPGYWGQGLQNPAVSGAGVPWRRVPRSSPGFCRSDWASQERAASMSRKRARLPSPCEGTELHDSSPSPAGSLWHSAGQRGAWEHGWRASPALPQRRSQAGNHNPARRYSRGA